MRTSFALLTLGVLTTVVAPAAFATEAYQLRTEYSQNPVYEGEAVTAKFVLYGTSPFVEAEVAKFPEFRGFWTQNHVLRQGPLPLVPEGGPQRLNQALIGSYTITPMIGKRDAEIIPMKMILRSHDFFQNEAEKEGMEIWSEKEALRVLPLPAPPAAFQDKFFGAVGNVSLSVENDAISFHPDEPFTVRVLVRGHANFPDLNRLATEWPDRVKEVTSRTFQDPSIPPTKIFEYTLVVQGEEPLVVAPVELIYFNPTLKQYQVTATPSLSLQPQPSPPLELLGPDAFGTPLSQEQNSFFWRTSPMFWVGQAIFLLLILGTLARRGRLAWELRPRTSYLRQLRARNEGVESALGNDPSRALGMLESALMKVGFERKRDQPRPPTHPEAIEHIKKNWSPDAAEQAKWVFDTWDGGFAPPHLRPPPAGGSRLEQAVRKIFAALKRPFRK